MARNRSYSFADAQNLAVRVLLAETSKQIPTYFETGKWREITLDYFNGCCAYTDKPLEAELIALDHVIPMNRECCGLHLFGNVLPVTHAANAAKHNRSLESYLKSDPTRLKKVRDFMKFSGFTEMHGTVFPIMSALSSKLYEEIKNVIEESVRSSPRVSFDKSHLKERLESCSELIAIGEIAKTFGDLRASFKKAYHLPDEVGENEPSGEEQGESSEYRQKNLRLHASCLENLITDKPKAFSPTTAPSPASAPARPVESVQRDGLSPDERREMRRRLEMWAGKPGQKHHAAMAILSKLHGMGISPERGAWVRILKDVVKARDPEGTARSLMTSAGQNYGCVTRERGGKVEICPSLLETVISLRWSLSESDWQAAKRIAGVR